MVHEVYFSFSLHPLCAYTPDFFPENLVTFLGSLYFLSSFCLFSFRKKGFPLSRGILSPPPPPPRPPLVVAPFNVRQKTCPLSSSLPDACYVFFFLQFLFFFWYSFRDVYQYIHLSSFFSVFKITVTGCVPVLNQFFFVSNCYFYTMQRGRLRLKIGMSVGWPGRAAKWRVVFCRRKSQKVTTL